MSHLISHSNGVGPQIYDQGKNLMQKLETSQTELSSTPHAPRQRNVFPFGLSRPFQPERRHRHYLDARRINAWSSTDLIKPAQLDKPKLSSERQRIKQEIEKEIKPVQVKPYRRTQGHKAPDCVPKLDLARFNEPDEQMSPIELIPNKVSVYMTTSRTDISWGTPRLPLGELQQDTVDVTTLKEEEEHKTEREDMENEPKLTTPVALPESHIQFVEDKVMSHEREKIETSQLKQQETKVGAVSNQLKSRGLERRLRFGARILTQNGRDVHRELCGFFFLADGSLTIYEFRQFGQKQSALPLLPRAVYRFPQGKREGEQYEIKHIKKGSTLYFETASLPALPESLSRRPLLVIRISEVDEQAKQNLMKEGLKPGEYHQIERYLTQSLSEESQRTTSLLETLQGMLRNRLHGRASQTLVGLGRLLKRLSTPEGLVGRLHLQQALRAFHISLTPEDFDQLWRLLHESYIVSGRKLGRDNGSGHEYEGVWLERCIPGLIGEMKEERQSILRKVFKKLDPAKCGSAQLPEIHKYFTPTGHPDVESGKKTVEEVVHTILGYLQPQHRLGEETNNISYADFEHYYIGVSLEIVSDHEFINLLRRCWSI